MDAEQALLVYLAAQSGVTTLLGSNPVRIYPLVLKAPNVYPSVTSHAFALQSVRSHDGFSNALQFTWQLTIWHTSYTSLKVVRDALHLALFGVKAVMSGIRISISNIFEPVRTWDTVTQVFQAVLDCLVYAELPVTP